MNEMSNSAQSVTMVKDGIHNPADTRHFMRIARPEHVITATIKGTEIARSARALKLKEVGYDIYDPVIYFPREDVRMERLKKSGKTTHCPLKGDTEYFDAVTDHGTVENAAWSYDRTIEIAREIQGYVGFDVRHAQVVEYTVQA
jgi:uncharacterized protein (DUF427 family)